MPLLDNDRDEAPLPPYLAGALRVLTPPDVAIRLGKSPQWINQEIHAGRIRACAYYRKARAGRTDPFVLISIDEAARYERELIAAGRRPRGPKPREPQQLRLMLVIQGGKA